jgi:hypothetical protein
MQPRVAACRPSGGPHGDAEKRLGLHRDRRHRPPHATEEVDGNQLSEIGPHLISGVIAAHRDQGIPNVEVQRGLICLDREAIEMTAD